jgi:hypothetical protein
MSLRDEYKFHPISRWINQHRDLQRGFSCTDIDLFFENHIRGYCMHMEFKHWDETVSAAQRANIMMIADVWSKAEPVRHYRNAGLDYSCHMDYRGYYVISLWNEEIENDHPIRIARIGAYDVRPIFKCHEEGAADILLSLCLGKYNDEYLQ